MKKYAPFVLRIGLGILFLAAGIMKLVEPAKITGLLTSLGFPGPEFWAWLVIISEIIFGAAVLTGFKVKYTVVPLAIILIVAMATNPSGQATSVLTNFALLAVCVSLWMSGPGKISLTKK